MALILTPDMAFEYAESMVKLAPLGDVKADILYDASAMIWTAAPWRWTVAVIAPVTITASTQDIAVTYPTDFMRIYKAYINDAQTARELKVVSALPVNTQVGMPNYLAKVSATARFDQTYPTLPTGMTPKLTIFYKKNAPAVQNNSGSAGVLEMDDEWFWVYRHAVLYYAYLYADDNRAGGSTVAVGKDGVPQVQYNGQLGVVHAAINEMRLAEPLLFMPFQLPSPEMSHG